MVHAIFREDKWHDPKWELYFAKNNTLTTSKILKLQNKRNSFKTIKDILLMILSKNNGILRIIKAKFDGEKRSNLQYTAESQNGPGE